MTTASLSTQPNLVGWCYLGAAILDTLPKTLFFLAVPGHLLAGIIGIIE
jgi:hypothetical protein